MSFRKQKTAIMERILGIMMIATMIQILKRNSSEEENWKEDQEPIIH